MELRRLKRIDYSALSSSKPVKRIRQDDTKTISPLLSNNPPVTTTRPEQKQRQQHQQHQQQTPDQTPQKSTSELRSNVTPTSKCIQLKRPVYKPSKEDIEREHQLEPIPQLELYLKSLGKLHQDLLTKYESLPSGNTHMITKQTRINRLRAAEDLNTVRSMTANLRELIKYKQLVEAEERIDASHTALQLINASRDIDAQLKEKLLTLGTLNHLSESDLLSKVAGIHSIDITDLKDIRTLWDGFPKGRGALDPNFTSAHEIAAISKKFDRQLAKERNTSLAWPTLTRTRGAKRKTGRGVGSGRTSAAAVDIGKDIPLYNSV